MTDEPKPTLHPRWLEMTVPPEDLPELAEWFRYLIGCLEIPAPKDSADRPAVTEKLRFYAGLARRGARERSARLASARNAAVLAAPSSGTASVVAPAQIPRTSRSEEITTRQASDLTGKSAERMRQLAAGGRIPGAHRTDRNVWLLPRAAVIAAITGGTDGKRGNTGPEGNAAA
jgi:hypothetical protein